MIYVYKTEMSRQNLEKKTWTSFILMENLFYFVFGVSAWSVYDLFLWLFIF